MKDSVSENKPLAQKGRRGEGRERRGRRWRTRVRGRDEIPSLGEAECEMGV